MKRKTLVVLLTIAALGIGIPVAWYLLKERSDIQAAVAQATNNFGSDDDGFSDGGGSGNARPSGGTPTDLLGSGDAAFLNYANSGLRTFTLPNTHKSHYTNDDLTKRLIAEAERRK